MVGPDPAGEEHGGLLVAAGKGGDIDQCGGELPVVDVGHGKSECLLGAAVPGE
ncbi:hypothetical protein [Streptomyces sp. 130]|uniref:hypothetical protein n=1 Tax=Streptomyces sp. 130 TaxID=2591006 RepID=UPI00163D9F0A|nr:hypothetical protein [Streptomyces sp. 130]